MRLGTKLMWGVSCAALSGCISASSGSWYPLHDETLPPSRVARLSGYVRFVDGRDLAEHGRSFELLPGCHVVGTPEKWGGSSLDAAVVATTGVVYFVLPMKPGHHYSIDVHTDGMAGPVGTLRMEARETASNGELTERYAPATSQAEIDTCLRDDRHT